MNRVMDCNSRCRATWLILCTIVWGAGIGSHVTVAQPPQEQGVSAERHSPAWDAITAELMLAEKTLVNAPGYAVRVASKWNFRGADQEHKGEHHLQLRSVGREQLRFEVRETRDGEPQFVVSYRQPELLRWAKADNKYSRVAAEDPRVELQSCGLTQTILELCAVEFLLMPHARESIQTQLVQVSDLGSSDGAHHFDVRMSNGHQVQVWFRDDNGLPTKIKSQYRKATDNQQYDEVTVESQLEWQIGATPRGGIEEFKLPNAAVQVADLSETLQGRGVEDLYGKPMPKVQFVDLAGKQLASRPDNQVALLYFWASWAAPSLEGIPAVLEFRDQLQAAGIYVLPVNVAEEPDRVKQFMELNSVSGTVGLDPTGAAVQELRITHLPAVVIVKRDGTVHQIIQNVKEDMRQRIGEEVSKLQNEK